MGKRSTPAPDPRIAQAAAASAANGAEYLDFMKSQAAITNGWAAEDRARYTDTFQPMQDKFIADAQEWDSPARTAARVDQNRGAVASNIATGRQMQQRQMAAMGVSPNSGRSAAIGATTGIQTGLALAGAENSATRDVRAEADAKQAAAINMGMGLAVNPGTSMGMSNGAAESGFGGNASGLNQQGALLQQNYANQVGAVNAHNQQNADMWGGIGSVVGMAFGSDRATKTNIKAPGRSLLAAVDAMPVKDWTYKAGKGDGGRHLGTMSQDFKRETGMGDGKTINVIDAIGTVMGAVQELSARVTSISGGKSLPQETKGSDTVAVKPRDNDSPASRKPRGLPDDMKMAA